MCESGLNVHGSEEEGKRRPPPAMGERRVHMGSVLVGYILFRVATLATSPLKFHSYSPESLVRHWHRVVDFGLVSP